MRILKFAAWDAEKKGTAPVQARAWIILWSAVGTYPCGNKEQTRTINSLWEALRGASEPVDEVSENRRLKTKGADVYLEDAEFRLLEPAIQKIREGVSGANADALLFVDTLIEKAPEISKEAYRKGAKLKLEPANAES